MKILTVPSSNLGRSVGDVFLALSSSQYVNRKTEAIGFLTHTNHAEISLLFRRKIDLLILSDAAEKNADLLNTINIHWNGSLWPRELINIQNPWRYFIMNQVAVKELSWDFSQKSTLIGRRVVVIFPERSDNHRLQDSYFTDFINLAKNKGFKVYTNCYINSNYVSSPALPGTLPLSQLSLSDIISIASDPSNVLVGTRSGLFDVLYFIVPELHARLVIIYPPQPTWLWASARFHNEEVRINFPKFYMHRKNIIEVELEKFDPNILL